VEQLNPLQKTTNVRQVTDKLDQIKMHQVHLTMIGHQTQNFSGDRH
jgi:hypothetical protein